MPLTVVGTVKPKIFAIFATPNKFVKIMGREYSIFNKLYCIITSSL